MTSETTSERFLGSWARIQNEVWHVTDEHGFHKRHDGLPEDVAFLVKTMLAVTELAEAVEGVRHGNPPSDRIPAFTAAEEEMADCVIRLMDLAEARGDRLAQSRPKLHGKAI